MVAFVEGYSMYRILDLPIAQYSNDNIGNPPTTLSIEGTFKQAIDLSQFSISESCFRPQQTFYFPSWGLRL